MAQAENTAVIQFPTPSGTWQDPTQVALFTASTGGTAIYTDSLDSNVDAPVTGADVEFAAGTLVVEIPNGNASNAGAQRAVNGFIDGTLYVGLLQASNTELSGNSYARVAIADSAWTVT